MLLGAGDKRRTEEGLVFFDGSRASGPAAHALIVGVGRYKTLNGLTSTTVSARAITDWFTGTGATSFKNNSCPLGSVALLLSEKDVSEGSLSSYRGGYVPRADFTSVQKAVWAWLDRLDTHKDNLAVLYIASHGASFMGRTGFLFEDYGTNIYLKTAGMSEMEQFIGAMEYAKPVKHLLMFDCCRSPTSLLLPWDAEFGNKLIALEKQDGDHGEPRMIWAIPSTSPDEVAGGRIGKTSIFAEALLDALNGVAGDPNDPGWPVRPGHLVEKINGLMALNRRADEKPQRPRGSFGGSFDICFPGEQADVPVYISLDDPEDWPHCTITVKAGGKVETFEGREDSSPFKMLRFPKLAELEAEASRDGASFGAARTTASPPARFLKISKTAPTAPIVMPLDPSRRIGSGAEMVVAIASPVRISAGAVCDVVRRDDPAKNPHHFSVPLGGETKVEVAAVPYVVTLTLPDGSVLTKEVTPAANEFVRLVFATQQSPHEWLATAAATGSIRPPEVVSRTRPLLAPELDGGYLGPMDFGVPHRGGATHIGKEFNPLNGGDFWFDADAVSGDRLDHRNPLGPAPITADTTGRQGLDLRQAQRYDPDRDISIPYAGDDGRFARLRINDRRLSCLQPGQTGRQAEPVFARLIIGTRSELAVLPSLGQRSEYDDDWNPFLLVDRLAASDSTMTTVVIDDKDWAGLLGFIANRDMASGARLLDSELLTRSAVRAMEEKVSNPLAALAGALVAVATTHPDLERRWDPWLENLINWFPGIPDGPIILGRRRLIRAKTIDEIEAAKASLLEGARRGVPVYSLSADWLARGLEGIGDKSAAFVAVRRAARRLSDRIDPSKAFTVIRVKGG